MSINYVSFYCIFRKWKKWVDEEIDHIITKNEGPNQDHQYHKTRYQNIEKELTDILRRLQKFRDNIRPTDQKKCKNSVLVSLEQYQKYVKLEQSLWQRQE